MTSTTSERRRLALSSDAARFDVSVPCEVTAREALASIGVPFEPTRHALVSRSGREVNADAPVSELTDGTLLTVVDLTASSPRPLARWEASGTTRTNRYAVWWLLATAAVMLAVAALVNLASGATLLPDSTRIPMAAALGAGAALAATLWTIWATRTGGTGFAIAATSSLAFAAGVVAVPQVDGAAHLAVTVGLLSATVLMALLTIFASARRVRGTIGAALSVYIVLTIVWGTTLMLHWSTTTAAAIGLGLVAPAIRWIPSLLLDFEDGYSINYVHFMSSRWTVRGTVPEDPGPVTMDVVKPQVDESVAKLTTGVVMFSAVALLTTPTIAQGLHEPGLLIRIGSTGALLATIGALFLGARRNTSPTLRWVPRVTAAAMTVIVVVGFALGASDAVRTVLAIALMAGAMLAALLIVPVSRGASSLIWSRLGDILESLSVALALPMALLGGDVVESVRKVMAG